MLTWEFFWLVTKSTLKEKQDNITKRYNYRLTKSVLKHILDHWFIAEYAKHDNYDNLLVFFASHVLWFFVSFHKVPCLWLKISMSEGLEVMKSTHNMHHTGCTGEMKLPHKRFTQRHPGYTFVWFDVFFFGRMSPFLTKEQKHRGGPQVSMLLFFF